MNIQGISQLTNSISNNRVNNTNSVVNFSNILKEQLDKLNEKQIEAENKTIGLITGEEKDLHNVMLNVEEAKMSLELAIQIRNKFVEAFQEINRIQF